MQHYMHVSSYIHVCIAARTKTTEIGMCIYSCLLFITSFVAILYWQGTWSSSPHLLAVPCMAATKSCHLVGGFSEIQGMTMQKPWLVVWIPLNISQLGWLFPIYGEKNVPNHQPNGVIAKKEPFLFRKYGKVMINHQICGHPIFRQFHFRMFVRLLHGFSGICQQRSKIVGSVASPGPAVLCTIWFPVTTWILGGI